jgi:carboxymethylenebutenolidase
MTQSQPDGYLAVPESGAGSGVLVLHAWWGLNGTIKSICDQLAQSGYIAFAPDLYHGEVADTIDGAEKLGGALDEKHMQAKAEIAEAVNFLSEKAGGESLAIVSFSLGAYYAIYHANQAPEQVRAVVLFYGDGFEDLSNVQASFLGHWAENDPYESRENVDQLEAELKQLGRDVNFHHYPGTGHWFFEPDRKDAYNQEAAELAWTRTLEFLTKAFAS